MKRQKNFKKNTNVTINDLNKEIIDKIVFLLNRSFQQSLVLADFIDGHCSKKEALAWQIQSIGQDIEMARDHVLENFCQNREDMNTSENK